MLEREVLVLKEIEENYSLVFPEGDKEVKLNRVGWGESLMSRNAEKGGEWEGSAFFS